MKVAPGTRTIILNNDGEPVYKNGCPVYSEPRLFDGEWGSPKPLPNPGNSAAWSSEIDGIWTDILIIDDIGNIVTAQRINEQNVYNGMEIVITIDP